MAMLSRTFLLLLFVFSLFTNLSALQSKTHPPYYPTDGWKYAKPSELGLSAEKLKAAEKFVTENLKDTYGVLVIRNGYIVYEKFFKDGSKTALKPVFSATKSVMALLTGIAIKQGKIGGVNDLLSLYLPEYFSESTDPRKKAITLKHILTMSSGLSWNRPEYDGSPDSILMDWLQSSDKEKFLLDRPMDKNPGEEFLYNSAASDLLSPVINRASGMSTKDFAEQTLFRPLKIKDYSWDLHGRYHYGGFGLSLNLYDLAKLGYLALRKGKWENSEVVPESWLKEATAAHIEAKTTAGSVQYGYLLWLFPVKKYQSYRLWGSGGQFAVVIPELDMVIAVLSNNYLAGSVSGVKVFPLFEKIVEAVVK